MARKEERISASVGLLFGLLIIWFILFIPQESIYFFVWRDLAGGGYPPPLSRAQISRVSLLAATLAIWFSGVCIYLLVKGISLLKRLRRIDGFTWVTIIVAGNFFVVLFLNIVTGWWSGPLAMLLLFTFLGLLFFWRPGLIIAAILFVAFFLAGPVGWWGRPLGLALLFIFLAFLFSRHLGFASVRLNFLRQKRVSLFLIFIVTLALFLKMFPVASLNDYIFQDDYGVFLYKTNLDLECLKEGYLYGWEGDFLGGYPTFLNLRSVVFLFLPLGLILPQGAAFHLFILANFLAFPFLVYLAARRFLAEEKEALLASLCSVALLCGYRANILGYGMIPTFVSVNLFLLVLIFFADLLKGKRLSGFFLVLVLSLSFFVHFGHFVHIVLFLGVIFIFLRLVKDEMSGLTWRKAIILFVAFLFMISPLLALLIRFKEYLVATRYWQLHPGGFSNLMSYLKETIWNARPSFHRWADEGFGFFVRRFHPVAVLFLPVALYNLKFVKKKTFLPSLLLIAVILFTLLSFIPSVELLMDRMNFFAPPILAFFLAPWIYQAHKRKAYFVHFLVAVSLFFLFVGFFMTSEPVRHIRNLSDFNPKLAERIKDLKGHMILFENAAGGSPLWDRSRGFDPAPRPQVHMVSYAQAYAQKRLLAHPGFDPHPYHKIRDVYVVNGTYLGKSLEEYPPSKFKALLKKWGVEYLVVWSDTTSYYLFGLPESFKSIYEDGKYVIFQFLQADPRSVVAENGQAEIAREDHFHIWLDLNSLKEGERVILRYHYFPLWRAFWLKGGREEEISLEDYQGQISFISPTSGDYKVHLAFRKEWWWAVLSLVGLGGLFVLSLKRRNL